MSILPQNDANTLRIIEKYLINIGKMLISPPQKTCIHYIRYRKDGQYYDNMKLSTFRSKKICAKYHIV